MPMVVTALQRVALVRVVKLAAAAVTQAVAQAAPVLTLVVVVVVVHFWTRLTAPMSVAISQRVQMEEVFNQTEP